jgi:hypothetical protein
MILLPIKQHENSQKPSLCNLQIFRPSFLKNKVILFPVAVFWQQTLRELGPGRRNQYFPPCIFVFTTLVSELNYSQDIDHVTFSNLLLSVKFPNFLLGTI